MGTHFTQIDLKIISAALTGGFIYISNSNPKPNFDSNFSLYSFNKNQLKKNIWPPLWPDLTMFQTSNLKPNFDSYFSIYSFYKNQLLKNFGCPYGQIWISLKVRTPNQILTQTSALTSFTQINFDTIQTPLTCGFGLVSKFKPEN